MLTAIIGLVGLLPARVKTNTIPTPTQIRRFTTLRRLPTYGDLVRVLGRANVGESRYEPSDAGTIKVHFTNPRGYAIFEPVNLNAFLARKHTQGEAIRLEPSNRAKYLVLNDFSANKGYTDAEVKRVISAATSVLGKPHKRYRVAPYKDGAKFGLSGEVAMWRRNRLQYIFTQYQEHRQAGLWITN